MIESGFRRLNDGEVLMVEANDNVSEFNEDLFMHGWAAQISGQGALACMYQFHRCDK